MLIRNDASSLLVHNFDLLSIFTEYSHLAPTFCSDPVTGLTCHHNFRDAPFCENHYTSVSHPVKHHISPLWWSHNVNNARLDLVGNKQRGTKGAPMICAAVFTMTGYGLKKLYRWQMMSAV